MQGSEFSAEIVSMWEHLGAGLQRKVGRREGQGGGREEGQERREGGTGEGAAHRRRKGDEV